MKKKNPYGLKPEGFFESINAATRGEKLDGKYVAKPGRYYLAVYKYGKDNGAYNININVANGVIKN